MQRAQLRQMGEHSFGDYRDNAGIDGNRCHQGRAAAEGRDIGRDTIDFAGNASALVIQMIVDQLIDRR